MAKQWQSDYPIVKVLFLVFALTLSSICTSEITVKVGEVEPAQWLKTRTTFCFQGNQGVETAVSYKAESCEMVVFDGRSQERDDFVMHHSKLQPRDNRLEGKDPIADQIRTAHEHGIKVIGVIQMGTNPWYLKRHPDCSLKYPDGSSSSMGCLNSPYGQFMIDLMVEIVTEYPLDGVSSDGFCANWCVCDYCKAQYKAEVGSDLPAREDINDNAFRQYLRWRDKKFNEYVLLYQKALKGVRKDLVFTPWFWGKTRWQENEIRRNSASVNLLYDMPMYEIFWDWSPDQGNGLVANFAYRWFVGAARNRPVMFMPSHKMHAHENISLPEIERDWRVYSVITNISGGGMIGMCGIPGTYMTGSQEDIARTFEIGNKNAPWLVNAQPLRYAAIVYSEDTDTFFASKDHNDLCLYQPWMKSVEVEKFHDRYLHHLYGAFRAMTEEHIPTDIIQSWDVEDGILDRYKVVVLPNTAILSEKAKHKLRQYVNNGGGLIATYLTSLSDEDGNLQKNFGLADLFKISFGGVIENRTLAFANTELPANSPDRFRMIAHQITGDPAIAGAAIDASKIVPYIGKSARVNVTEGGEAFIVRRSDSAASESPDKWNYPAAVSSTYGKGKVVYFASAIDHGYFRIPFPYERTLFAGAIKYVAAAPAPVEVKASPALYVTFSEQKDKNRIIVSLLNEINSSANRAVSSGDVPVREDIVPISGVELVLRDKTITKVVIEPENQPLEFEKNADSVRVKIPPIELFTRVVAYRDR